MINKTLRPFYFILGWICVILGGIGAILPIMPTTPFLIVAAYLFSKSSPRFHKWLLDLPQFGPVIKEWEETKTIKKEVKIFSVVALSLSVLGSLIFVPVQMTVKYILIACWLSVSIYILTRKSK